MTAGEFATRLMQLEPEALPEWMRLQTEMRQLQIDQFQWRNQSNAFEEHMTDNNAVWSSLPGSEEGLSVDDLPSIESMWAADQMALRRELEDVSMEGQELTRRWKELQARWQEWETRFDMADR